MGSYFVPATVVPGGGISLDGTRWISCRPRFFLPVRVLSRLFRRLFLTYLEEAFDSGKLRFFSSLETLRDRQAFNRHLDPVRNSEWVVYAKPPFAGPQQVVVTSAATPTGWPSPIIGSSISKAVK